MGESSQLGNGPRVSATFLANRGAVGALILALDWSTTPLGPIEKWPTSLRNVVDLILACPVAMVALWGPHHIQIYNEAYAEIAGQRHPSALGQATQLCWPEVWQFNEPIYAAVRLGKAMSFKGQMLDIERSGKLENAWFDLSYSGLHDDTGGVTGVLVTVVETTSHVLAERRVTYEAERQRQLFDQAPGFVCISSGPEHVYEFGNEAYARLIGRSDFIGKTVRDALPDIAGQGIYEKLDAVYATGERYVAEHLLISMRRRPGTDFEARYVDFIYAPVVDETGRVTGIFTQGHDVTDAHLAREALKDSETRLRALNADLEQQIVERRHAEEALQQSRKLEAMGQLTGGVAHDFNNLLTPIIGGLDMLQRRGIGDERSRRLIDAAMHSADRARTLVQRLLAFARRQPLQSVTVDLPDLVGGMVDLMGSTCGPQTRLHLDLPGDLPPVRIDPGQLEMAILNLVANARDAMPKGGTLTISAAAETVGPTRHKTLAAGNYVRLSVIDSGSGMDEGTLARAVEPFFSTKGVGKGTGLGLSMVHGLATQLGGSLQIKSLPNDGTTIEIWLPASTQAVERPSARRGAAGESSVGTVLVIDDEDLVRMTTSDMLVEMGFEVVEASSAEEALPILDENDRISLIVTDHMMPGLTGTEFARIVRGLRPGLPLLLVSGYAEVEGVAPDLPRLMKPFRRIDLETSISALFQGVNVAN